MSDRLDPIHYKQVQRIRDLIRDFVKCEHYPTKSKCRKLLNEINKVVSTTNGI